MKIIDLVPGTQAWHEYRASRIGASESSILMNIFPFRTPKQLYEEKIFGKRQADSFSMKRGREREQEALKWAEQKLGVMLASRVVEHEEYPWKFATLDGISSDLQTIVEVKWCRQEVHELAKQGEVIDYYFCQVQSQMACTGLPKAYFLSCYQEKGCDPEFILVEVERDQDYIDAMIKEEKKWYLKHLVQMEEPDLQEKDYIVIQDERKEAINNLLIKEWELSEEIKKLEEQKKMIKSQVFNISGECSFSTDLFKATKYKVQGTIDYKAIKELQGVDLEAYRKDGRYQWKISRLHE